MEVEVSERKKILMIDDDINLVNVFRTVFETKGYDFAGENSEYSAFSKIPILMLTSVTSKTNLDFSERVGTALLPVDAFMEKPVRPGELLTIIEKLLATGEKADPTS
jgi:CheY-like chemotaxis protein